MSIDYCFAGDFATVNCGGVCVDAGTNATSGCLGTGEGCDRFTYATTTPCQAGVQECTLERILMLCLAGASNGSAANFRKPHACRWVCIDLGYLNTVGCGRLVKQFEPRVEFGEMQARSCRSTPTRVGM